MSTSNTVDTHALQLGSRKTWKGLYRHRLLEMGHEYSG